MKFNRLQNFQKDNTKLSRYRVALAILHDLGIDYLLADLGSVEEIAPDQLSNALVASALQHQRALGFRKCIEMLFTLDRVEIPKTDKVLPDYGALEKMIEDGRIAAEDAEKFAEGF